MRIIHFDRLLVVLIAVMLCQTAYSQSLATGQEIQYNPITTAVPFLTITPDSRHGAMGDVGVAHLLMLIPSIGIPQNLPLRKTILALLCLTLHG